jgi:hypothetical protein
VFERPHHRRIARVLEAMDAALLQTHQCWFAGGTAIALLNGEFRESVDIDFVVASLPAYRALRERLADEGLRVLLPQAGQTLEINVPLRLDQYGLRARIAVDGVPVKLEVIHEARLKKVRPSTDGQSICGVATACRTDLAAMKLLANVDRWADDSVFARDVIDLAYLALPTPDFANALALASEPYGPAVRRDLVRAVAALREREGWLDRCLQALAIKEPKAKVWQRLRKLDAIA